MFGNILSGSLSPSDERTTPSNGSRAFHGLNPMGLLQPPHFLWSLQATLNYMPSPTSPHSLPSLWELSQALPFVGNAFLRFRVQPGLHLPQKAVRNPLVWPGLLLCAPLTFCTLLVRHLHCVMLSVPPRVLPHWPVSSLKAGLPLHLCGSSTLYSAWHTVNAQEIPIFLLPPSTPPQCSERSPTPIGSA